MRGTSFIVVSILVLLLPDSIKSKLFSSSADDNKFSEDPWIVHTNSGPVEGIVTSVFPNHDVDIFYGIPYAEPPIGNRRFKPPQPVKPWINVFKATEKPLPCYQSMNKNFGKFMAEQGGIIRGPFTEDCLKLNIWVPKPVIQDSPVLVVFHAGYFAAGSNAYPDGSVLSVYAQNVIVSMNYRLGAFGFLYLGVPEAPGNVGLLDQQMALKWVHENIHHFGGNSEAVILVGAGDSGGASAGYHMLSPGSANYFKSVVAYSGAPICSWVFLSQERSLNRAAAVSQSLGCHGNNTNEEIDCLLNAHPEDIVDADVSQLQLTKIPFSPTVDGKFITESPEKAIKSGNFKKTTVMLIFNTHEGSLMLKAVDLGKPIDFATGMNLEEFQRAVKRIHPFLSEAGVNVVKDYYLETESDVQQIRNSAIQMYSDFLFGCCISRFAEYITQHGGSVFLLVNDIRKNSNPEWYGSSHAISVQYAFGYPLVWNGFSDQEKNISETYMKSVNGHTCRKASELTNILELYNTKDKSYTFWDEEGPHYFSHYREDHCKLWRDIIPKYQIKQ